MDELNLNYSEEMDYRPSNEHFRGICFTINHPLMDDYVRDQLVITKSHGIKKVISLYRCSIDDR